MGRMWTICIGKFPNLWGTKALVWEEKLEMCQNLPFRSISNSYLHQNHQLFDFKTTFQPFSHQSQNLPLKCLFLSRNGNLKTNYFLKQPIYLSIHPFTPWRVLSQSPICPNNTSGHMDSWFLSIALQLPNTFNVTVTAPNCFAFWVLHFDSRTNHKLFSNYKETNEFLTIFSDCLRWLFIRIPMEERIWTCFKKKNSNDSQLISLSYFTDLRSIRKSINFFFARATDTIHKKKSQKNYTETKHIKECWRRNKQWRRFLEFGLFFVLLFKVRK